jgi:hypothetical protein
MRSRSTRFNPVRRAFEARESDIVCADRDETAVSNLQLTMQLDKQFGLAAVLGAITSAAQYEDHGMLPLQFRKLAARGSVVSEFIVRKERAGYDIGSHSKSSLPSGTSRG